MISFPYCYDFAKKLANAKFLTKDYFSSNFEKSNELQIEMIKIFINFLSILDKEVSKKYEKICQDAPIVINSHYSILDFFVFIHKNKNKKIYTLKAFLEDVYIYIFHKIT